jgi:hypothetical protein
VKVSSLSRADRYIQSVPVLTRQTQSLQIYAPKAIGPYSQAICANGFIDAQVEIDVIAVASLHKATGDCRGRCLLELGLTPLLL